MNRIRISDVTMKQGSQEVSLSFKEKIELAKLLDKLCVSVIHRDRQIVCDIIAEGSHGRVVIRSAPLSEQIREAVHQYLCTRFFAICKDQFLSRLFAPSVIAVITSNTGCLDRG